jgi:UDP-N-acetylglucosamine--N-acetylmuramyl-(pentapeptide) pyrophosphoryl-undecaprenol N-acetylglucosamine transferase
LSVVLIAAGGTGGHLYPALATAGVLRERGHDVSFAGGGRLEASLVPAAGFALHELPVRGFPTLLSLRSAAAAVATVRAVGRARGILRKIEPSVVLGMGGYPSFAPSWAAGGMGLPVVLHEQNARLTRSHRWALRRADVLALSLPVADPIPDDVRVELVGNPIRMSLARVATDAAERERLRESGRRRFSLVADRTTLLVFGGSQGASALNETLPRLSWPGSAQILHIAGAAHEDAVRAAWTSAMVPVTVVGYVDAMEEAYAVADVVVSRSGATTVAELALFGLPAVLVPLPHAARDAQEANARVLEARGAARVVAQGAGFQERLLSEIEALLADEAQRGAMSDASRALGRPDAAERLADVVESALA